MSGLRQITRISTLAVMTTVVGLGPGSGLASGQERDRDQTRLEESLPEGAANRVRELSRELAEAGIPPQLIRRKAIEGVAKGVPPDRIMPALEAYSRRLQEVPPEAIRSLSREQGARRGEGSLAVPLLVLGDLTEAGVPTDQALEAVQEAMRRGSPEQGMMNFSAAVRRRVRQGEDPATAFEQVRVRATERMRQAPDGSGQSLRGPPGSRPMDAAPVPPGSEPPTRSGSGGRSQGPN
jgi:hypothetical protein